MSQARVFEILSFIWLVGEVLIVLLTTRRRGEGKVHDRGSQIILWIVIVTSFSIDGRLHDVLPENMPGSHSWLQPLAIGMLVFGLVFRAVAVFNLGRAFSANVTLREGQKLQRSGLYAVVRHPSYLGLEIIFLAFALHSRTWACFAVVLIPPSLALLYRIHVEEKALRLAFGAEYDDYCRQTKRLIPGVY